MLVHKTINVLCKICDLAPVLPPGPGTLTLSLRFES